MNNKHVLNLKSNLRRRQKHLPNATVSGLSDLRETQTIRVLHVDDDSSIREITKLMLLDLDSIFDVDGASCVDDGLRKLISQNYDVVVCDYEMPQKDGLQFLKEFHQQKHEIPFILFTGKGREEVAIKALNLGADGYINKQGNPETVYGELSHSIKLVVERNKAKKALQEQNTRFTKLAANTPGMLFQFLKHPDGTYCVPFSSDGISDIFGCSLKEVRTDFSPIVRAIFPEDLLKVIKSIEESANNLSLWQCEYRVQLPGQEIRWLWGQSTPEKLEDGSILWSGYNTDVTERKMAEEKFRETYAVLEKVGEGVDAGLAVIDKDYRVIWANKRLKDLGVASNKKCYQTFNNLETVCPDCGVKKVFEQDLSLDVHEFEAVNSKGEKTWIELRVTPLKDKEGNVIAALELAVPINERKKAIRIAQEELALRNALLDNIPCIALILDKKTRKIVASNKIAKEMGAVPGKTCYETCANDSFPCSFCLAPKLWKTGEKQVLEEVEHNGKYYKGLWLPYNETLYVHYIFDITETKKAEEKLKASKAKLKSIIENSTDQVFMIDKNLRYLLVNPTLAKLLGMPPEEIIGKSISEVYPPETAISFSNNIKRVFETAENLFIDEKMSVQGHELFISTSLNPVKDETGVVIAVSGVVRDISGHKKTEAELGKSIAKFKEFANQLPEMVLEIDTTGNIVFANLRSFEITGYSKEDFEEGFDVLRLVALEDRERAKENVKKRFDKKGVHNDEYLYIRKDGSRFPVSLSSSPIFEGDKIVGARAIIIDISEQKKEETQLKEDNRQFQLTNEKLRVLGSLTRHDIGNKLMGAKLNVYLLKKRLGANAELDSYFDGVESAFGVVDKIFDFNRLYGQIGFEKPSKENVFECFSQAVALVQNLGSVRVFNECQGLELIADSLLKQLFYNFIDNSMKHGEKVTQIRLYCTKDVDSCKIIYEDDGVGIPEANKRRLFEVGFTTGNGSGLGLALIKRIIDVYGWNIVEAGEPGKGVKFVISIPLPLVKD